MITRVQLGEIAPGPVAESFLGPLNSSMTAFRINQNSRTQAAFLAQVVHESGGFRTLSENLNYSPAGLLGTWPTRFTKDTANRYGRIGAQPADQVAIANIAYANRLGNGNPASGDGWTYRGRGPIQITGRTNYARCGVALGMDLIANPSRLLMPREGCLAAAWYWDQGNPTGRSLSELALAGEIDAVSIAVNGGRIGLAERRALYERILGVLA